MATTVKEPVKLFERPVERYVIEDYEGWGDKRQLRLLPEPRGKKFLVYGVWSPTMRAGRVGWIERPAYAGSMVAWGDVTWGRVVDTGGCESDFDVIQLLSTESERLICALPHFATLVEAEAAFAEHKRVEEAEQPAAPAPKKRGKERTLTAIPFDDPDAPLLMDRWAADN